MDAEKAKSLIVGSGSRFREALGDKLLQGPVCLGINKIRWGQYELLFASFCDVSDWGVVRLESISLSYKILSENDIKPIGGDQLPL